MKTLLKHIFSAFLAVIPFAASAQVLPFTAIDYSPVTLAKGGTSVVETTSVANAAFGNPAAVAFFDGKADVNASYATWSPSQVKTTVINAAGAYKVNDKIGVSAAYSGGTYPEYEIFDLAGMSDGTFTPKHMYAGVGVSYLMKPELAFGVNVGFASNTLSKDVSYSAVSADLFAMYCVGPIRVAVGVSELGPKVASESGEFSLPTAARLGFGYDLMVQEDYTVDLSVDASYYLAGAFSAAVGTSYNFKDMFSLRAGYRYGGESVIPSYASVGLGAGMSGVMLNVAYLFASETLSNTLCVGCSYSF